MTIAVGPSSPQNAASVNTMWKRTIRLPALALAVALLATAAAAHATSPQLPDKFKRSPWSLRTLSVGSPSEGTLVRGRKLRPSAAVRMWNKLDLPSHATPDLLKAIDRAAKKVRKAHPGSTLLVVALSHQKGGPVKEKRSHQTGRDADLVFYATNEEGKPASSSKLARFGGDGVSRDKKLRFDDARNWALVDALARDPDANVTHIFVDPKIRMRLLAFAAREGIDEERVEKVKLVLFQGDATEPLDAFFHVRVGCPAGQDPICKN